MSGICCSGWSAAVCISRPERPIEGRPQSLDWEARIARLRVRIVQCRGTPFEIGRQQALLFAATPKGRAFLRRKVIKLPWWFDIRAEQRMFAKYSPAIWEEIAGLADGLGTTVERAALYFGNDGLRPPLGGCPAVLTPPAYARD